MFRILIATSCLLVLCGCGGGSAPTPAPTAPATQQETVSRIGDITIRATALQTSTLAAEVARQYGIARDDRTVMLLVGVRQGSDAQEIALPADITATVTNLSGQRQPVTLRELRSGDPSTGPGQALLDYVGTVETSLPDTLRFDISIVREGGARSTMQFSREFYPH
ncbi:DUF4426 domain-containing protein [Lysobacter sp. Root494]|uniref:DUF4426 domain-containing protein n=1 Tax=Lysobacter sp. Root494 TaxID=1736549 RepID=UPI0006FFA7BF|nr:DUF4426 domain-containing protein [Lysobacter sp. Root494]KQY51031.1 hypothetical protein ASD14_09385 [Lysobacter sp. Root494]